ncbi:MAG: hypothetical protein AAFZ65_17795 [Planctomycetota bacterium]
MSLESRFPGKYIQPAKASVGYAVVEPPRYSLLQTVFSTGIDGLKVRDFDLLAVDGQPTLGTMALGPPKRQRIPAGTHTLTVQLHAWLDRSGSVEVIDQVTHHFEAGRTYSVLPTTSAPFLPIGGPPPAQTGVVYRPQLEGRLPEGVDGSLLAVVESDADEAPGED